MSSLDIQVTENGFLLNAYNNIGCIQKSWVFETAEGLATFVKKWGEENTKKQKTTDISEGTEAGN